MHAVICLKLVHWESNLKPNEIYNDFPISQDPIDETDPEFFIPIFNME